MSFASIAFLCLAGAALAGPAAAQTIVDVQRSAPRAPLAPQSNEPIHVEIAGRSLPRFPHFDHVRSFYEGSQVEAAFDTGRRPELIGRTADVWLCEHKDAAGWQAVPTLVDVRGAFQTITFVAGGVLPNRLTLDIGTLSGFNGDSLGRAYDVVLDLDRDGNLSAGDWVDGAGADPGFWMLYPTVLQGIHPITEVLYSGGTWLGQDLYYPSNIASLGELPLVVVSHGNGHNYQWYDHIGFHLASWGYIVMSHQNNTAPGTETASTTTLTNTDYFLGNLATIAGGALLGHVDRHKIVWIGHSRGGEGVVRAYDRMFDGAYTPVNFTLSDIVLVSSIAPTDFQGNANTNPHGVPYSLWTGGADSDVNGCADCNLCQTFHLHERATGVRSSISLHGAGHGAFHNNSSSSLFAAGPCQLSRGDVNQIMRGYLLPLLEYHARGNRAGYECLWRQWETFSTPGAPVSTCVTVDLMHQAAPGVRRVIDDFQSNPGVNLSSSGGLVTFDVANLTEGRFDDPGTVFTASASEPMNGMTLSGGVADTTSGIVFEWNGADRVITFDLVPALRDATSSTYLSFRAAQAARHALTGAVLGDLDFTVRVRDSQGGLSAIAIGAYGGGIEEPYQRTGCGTGAGWANEFETIRIRLDDFARDATPVNLSDLVAIDLLFGPTWGAAEGRLGFDDLEYVRD